MSITRPSSRSPAAAQSEDIRGENARLRDDTARLREEIARRDAELAIINGVQDAIGAALDFQAIVDVVGDKLREVFATGDLSILWWNASAGRADWLYSYEHGVRMHSMPPVQPRPGGYYDRLIRDRRTMVFASIAEQQAAGMFGVPGTDIGRSVVVVPMVTGDRFLGNVFVENHGRDDAFGPSDVRLIETVTASMAVALLNARSYEAERQRAAELAVINSIQQGLVARLDLDAIVDLVGDRLRDVFGGDDVVIGWFDEATFTVTPAYAYQEGVRLTDIRPFVLDRSARNLRVVHERVAAGSRESDNPGGRAVPGTKRPLSDMRAPVVAGDRVIALVNVDHFEREDAFDDDDLRLLTTVCTSMGIALQSARLFDETQRLLKETEQRNAELAVINSIQEGMARGAGLPGHRRPGRRQAARGLRERRMSASTGGTSRPDSPTRCTCTSTACGSRIDPFKPGGAAARILRDRATIVAGTREEQATEGFFTAAGSDQSLSVVGVPIVGGDRVIGMIILEDHEREHAFGESDVRLLTTVAASMGVALENARLFDETQRLLKETEARNAELAVMNSVQQGVGAELNFGAIYDLVGDKMREIFAYRRPDRSPGATRRRRCAASAIHTSTGCRRTRRRCATPCSARSIACCCNESRSWSEVCAEAAALELHHFAGTARAVVRLRAAVGRATESSARSSSRTTGTNTRSAKRMSGCSPRSRPAWASRSRTRGCSTRRSGC